MATGTGLWFLLFIFGNVVPSFDACTLWGGAGADVSGGGALICTSLFSEKEVRGAFLIK